MLVGGLISAFDFTTLGPLFCNIDLQSILDMGINYHSPDDSIQVWILMKKRVVLFQHDHGQFQQIQSIQLNDTPLQMVWAGTFLYLQFKDKLVQYAQESGLPTAEMKFASKLSAPGEMRYMNSECILVNTGMDIL